MREYGRIAPTFWTRGTGKSLRGDPIAMNVALYLMSAPSSNMIGLYYIPVETIALETGSPLEAPRKGPESPPEGARKGPMGPSRGVREALERLSQGGFCLYDHEEDFVLVHTMARRQLGLEEGECLKHDDPDPKKWDQRCHGVVKHMRECVSPRLLQAFWERYKDVFGLPEPWWTIAPCKPPESPPRAPSKAPESQAQEQAQDQEQAQEKDQEGDRGNPKSEPARPQEPNASANPSSAAPTTTTKPKQPELRLVPKDPEPAKPAKTNVELVFDYWREKLSPNAKLDDKRKKILRKALKLYSVDELKKVVDGTLRDDWRMGRDTRTEGKKYIGMDLLYRNAEKIDEMIAKADEPDDSSDWEWTEPPPAPEDPAGTVHCGPTDEFMNKLDSLVASQVVR
jgi:hypothetical protein